MCKFGSAGKVWRSCDSTAVFCSTCQATVIGFCSEPIYRCLEEEQTNNELLLSRIPDVCSECLELISCLTRSRSDPSHAIVDPMDLADKTDPEHHIRWDVRAGNRRLNPVDSAAQLCPLATLRTPYDVFT
jgi:hypothetical protein